VAWVGLALYTVLVATRPRWLRERPLFDVLLGAGLVGHARALAVRLPHIAALITFQVAMLHAFGVPVPVVDALAALPVVFLVAALPLSVQGLGTTQAAMIYFFARYAPGARPAQEAAVMTASLVGQALGLMFQALLGVACMKSRVGRALSDSARNSQVEAGSALPSSVQAQPGVQGRELVAEGEGDHLEHLGVRARRDEPLLGGRHGRRGQPPIAARDLLECPEHVARRRQRRTVAGVSEPAAPLVAVEHAGIAERKRRLLERPSVPPRQAARDLLSDVV
jgi:hypothetical protein